MAVKIQNTGVIAAGLALFSMYFGAGDLIWPLILGGESGSMNFYAMLGLLISGVSLPLLGAMAMTLFHGDYRNFFGQIGRVPSIFLIFIIQAILGPFGSLPRLFTLAYATIQPYIFDFITLPVFSVLSCLIVFLFMIKKRRIIDILGFVLCPILLISLISIFVMGFYHHPAAQTSIAAPGETFFSGLNVGYNTLDLIASFIFAPLILAYFQHDKKAESQTIASRQVFKKMTKACLIAGGLLGSVYIGLTYLASYYTPFLDPHPPEGRLAAISLHLLGNTGAFLSCIAVSLSCLTTAIPISVITADYIHTDFMKGKGSYYIAIAISLGLSAAVANLGFMGIANMLSPILQILCPGLIILSILNIFHKLYEMRMRKAPVFVAFVLSFVGYVIRLT